MNRQFVAAAFAAAALLPATATAAPRELSRYYSIACEVKLGSVSIHLRNTTPHPIPAGTQVWVRILHKSGAVQARTFTPEKTIAPGAAATLATIGSARSCGASVVLVPNVESTIARRPQLGRPLIEKGPKRI